MRSAIRAVLLIVCLAVAGLVASTSQPRPLHASSCMDGVRLCATMCTPIWKILCTYYYDYPPTPPTTPGGGEEEEEADDSEANPIG